MCFCFHCVLSLVCHLNLRLLRLRISADYCPKFVVVIKQNRTHEHQQKRARERIKSYNLSIKYKYGNIQELLVNQPAIWCASSQKKKRKTIKYFVHRISVSFYDSACLVWHFKYICDCFCYVCILNVCARRLF